jgi:hypothetical protein
LESKIISKIEEQNSNEIQSELQLSRELNKAVRREIETRWMEKMQTWKGVAQTEAVLIEGITTCDNPASPRRPMEGITIDGTAIPTTEEFLEGLISSGGMNYSQHVEIGLELVLAIVAMTYKRVRILVTQQPGQEDGAKAWLAGWRNRRNAKATRRIDLPRTLGYSR